MDVKYNISKNKFRELKYFCLQYDEKKERLQSICCLSSPRIEGVPKGSGTSNPTAEKGILIAQLKKDIEVIEQSAIETSSEFYQYIMENITKGIPWEYLDIPLSRRSFYYMRRKFFYILSSKKK